MKEFYSLFYAAVENSPAHHTFCERVFGKDLCQHGFADMEQIELLLQVTQLDASQHVLDLGCGNGLITEYLSDHTGANVTGLDFIPLAVNQASQRTAAKVDRLAFLEGDINHLQLPAEAFDLIVSIDSMYFSQDYTATLSKMKAALRKGGQIALFYSYGREPWVPLDEFPKEMLPADKTPLADALQANGLVFKTWDLTSRDYLLAVRRKLVLTELKSQFEAEGNLFIYENRLGDADGIQQAIKAGLHARYLYLAQ